MKEPKIRIKGFQGEWEIDKIGNFSTSFSGGTPNAGVSAYYGGNIPFIRSGEIHEDKTELSLTEEGYNNSSAKIVERGTLLYALYGATSGDVAISKIRGAINQAILAITPYRTVETDFLADFLLCNKYKIVGELLQGGQGNLSGSLVKDINVAYPCISEQQSIASYFQHLDSLIQSTTKKIESLKQVKAASLQSMFPQEGETTPRVRFKGFEGEWEKVRLGDCFIERIENNIYGEMLSVTINNGIIKASDNGRFDNSNNDKSKYKVVRVGDIAYNTMRMWQGASGYSCYDGIVSPAYTVITPQTEVDSLFFAYMFKTQHMIALFGLHSQGLTKDTWNLKFPALSLIHILRPNLIAEQRAIASYFTSLDRKITLQTQRLEKLKRIKAACLDEMFV